jgi:SAM-dependent methyltransferase
LKFDYATNGQTYHDQKHASLGEDGYRLIADARAAKIARWVSATDNVLEFGVGVGWNLARLPCAERVGYDVSTHLRDFVESKGIRFISTEADIPFGSYDVVIAHHVLEHLTDPFPTLLKIGKWLRPGGRLLVYLPYEFERRYRGYDAEDLDHHLYSWNAQTAAALVASAGFEIRQAKVTTFGFDRFAAKRAAALRLGKYGYLLLRSGLRIAAGTKEVLVVSERVAGT